MKIKTVYVATRPVFQTDARGNTKELPVGHEVNEKQFLTLTKNQQAKFTAVQKPARKATKNVPWTGAELDLLIDLYLKHVDTVTPCDNRGAIVAEFQRAYPDRAESAVVLGAMQIVALDTYYPARGMTDTSQAMVDRLYQIDPVRFPGGADLEVKTLAKIDRLLAQLR
jgi:hypothetical protein